MARCFSCKSTSRSRVLVWRFGSGLSSSMDRRHRIVEAQRAYDAADSDVIKAKINRSNLDDDDDNDFEGVKTNGKSTETVKKMKKKKPKKPKVTVAEAAAKIDPADLSTYLVEQQEIQMHKFSNFYGKAF